MMNNYSQHNEYWIDLVIDYLTGSITDEHKMELKNWIKESEENAVYFNQLKELWYSAKIADNKPEFEYERAYSLFKDRIRISSERNNKDKKQRSVYIRYAAIAAVLVPFVILSYFTGLYFQSQANGNGRLSEICVPNGSRSKLKLADGTVLWLNSGSSVQYNDRFGKDNRILNLEGEAYLEVAHNKELPFTVKTKDVEVKVLGTKFNVNAYKESEEVRVSLFEGSVRINNTENTRSIVLKPTETAVYETGTDQIKVLKNCTDNALDWMHGCFIFNGESFEQIARTLERSFNVVINVRNESIKKRCFAGDFVNHETIEQIFDVMSTTGEFRYIIKGNVIDVY